MLKFLRNYKLTVQTNDRGDLLTIEYPMTLAFHVRRENLSSSGAATFMISNLNPLHRNQIYFPRANSGSISRSVRLEAGYGNNMSVIFDGFITEARSYRQEGQVNFITEITAYDYISRMADAFSSWTVASPNNSYVFIIRKIIVEDLKGKVGAIGSFPGNFARNPSLSEPSWEALKKITGGKCYIDNGKVYCLNDNEVISGAIRTITSSSGLLGSPKMDGQWLFFDMIFEPSLQNGQKVNLDSTSMPQFNGVYKVISIDHSGTISGAVGGKCKTTVGLMLGSAGLDDPFTLVATG